MSSNYQLEYNGLILNNTSQGLTARIDGLHDIPIETISNSLVDQDGGIIYKQKYSARIIGITLNIYGVTADAYFDYIASLQNAFTLTDKDMYLKITPWTSSPTTRKLLGRVITKPRISEINLQPKHATDVFTQLYCSNPFYRDENDTVYPSISNATFSGSQIDAVIPMSLGQANTSFADVVNNGDKTTTPSFKINGPFTNATVTNQNTGDFFIIKTSIGNGDFVRVYEENGSKFVLLNDTTNYRQFFEGKLFGIARNQTNRIVYQSNDGNGSCIITFNPEYENLV